MKKFAAQPATMTATARARPEIFALLMAASVRAPAQAAPMAQATITVQAGRQARPIISDLFGIFFEDINYAADGGLYAELIQNRSFEDSSRDNAAWNSLTSWELFTRGGGKGRVAIESAISLHPNNPQYAVLTVEEGGACKAAPMRS